MGPRIGKFTDVRTGLSLKASTKELAKRKKLIDDIN